MVNEFTGMSGFGEMQLAILYGIIIPRTRHGILMVRFKRQKTGLMVIKMEYGLGGIKMDILIVQENIKII